MNLTTFVKFEINKIAKMKFAITLLLSVITMFSVAQVPIVVKWYSIEEAIKLNEKAPRKLYVDVYTDWCGWCKKMDSNTFSNPVIAKMLNENFYPVKLNAEDKKDITYKGHVYVNKETGARSTHEFAVALLQGKLSYPSTVFMDENNAPITYLAGYLTPEQLEPILEFFSSNSYKTEKWEDFVKHFTSQLSSQKKE